MNSYCKNSCNSGGKVISKEIVKEVYIEKQIIIVKEKCSSSKTPEVSRRSLPLAAGKATPKKPSGKKSLYYHTPARTSTKLFSSLMKSPIKTIKSVDVCDSARKDRLRQDLFSTLTNKSADKSPRTPKILTKTKILNNSSKPWLYPDLAKSKNSTIKMTSLPSYDSSIDSTAFFLQPPDFSNNSASLTLRNDSQYGDLPKWDISRISKKGSDSF